MRKPLLLIFTNAVLLLAIFVLLAQSLFIVHRIAQAEAVTGKVWVQRVGRGEFSPLAAGATIGRGDVVRTDKDSSVEFKWRDGTRWKLGAQTQLALRKATVDSIKKSEISQFELASGRILVRAVKAVSSASRFEIQTPAARASAREGVWSMEVSGDQTQVDVKWGDVEVSNFACGEKAVLKASGRAIVTASGLKSSRDVVISGFDGEKSILQPALEARVQPLGDGFAVIQGETEAGDRVRIGGENVPVVGTGGFFKRVPLKRGHNSWQVESTDRNGASSSVVAAFDFAPKK